MMLMMFLIILVFLMYARFLVDYLLCFQSLVGISLPFNRRASSSDSFTGT